MIRFLCKKDVDLDGKDTIRVGDIVYVYFDNEFASIISVKTGNIEDIHMDACFRKEEFLEHFIRYDNRETIECSDMMNYYIFKHGTQYSEKDMLYKIKAYADKRLKFLKQCKTEDTRREPNTTETPPGTSAN